jgi:hypothetical protein
MRRRSPYPKNGTVVEERFPAFRPWDVDLRCSFGSRRVFGSRTTGKAALALNLGGWLGLTNAALVHGTETPRLGKILPMVAPSPSHARWPRQHSEQSRDRAMGADATSCRPRKTTCVQIFSAQLSPASKASKAKRPLAPPRLLPLTRHRVKWLLGMPHRWHTRISITLARPPKDPPLKRGEQWRC